MQRPNRTSQSNAVVGARSALANLLSELKLAAVLIGLVAPLVGAIAEYGYVMWHTDAAERQLAMAWVQATAESFAPPGWSDRQLAFDYGPRRYHWPIEAVAHHLTVLEARDSVAATLHAGWRYALFFGVLAAAALWIWLQRRGQLLREDNFLRGGWVVTPRQLQKLIRKKSALSVLAVGPVRLAQPLETQHLLIVGTPGTGKSVAMGQALEGVGRQWPAIIYDTKGDFLVRSYRPGLDVILNPLDARSPAWTPWDEIEMPADAEVVAKSWIPSTGQGETYWVDAARQLFVAILLSVPETKRTNRELWRLVAEAEQDELAALLRGTSAHRLFADSAAERMRESVRNTLVTAVRGLQELEPDAKAGAGFSVTRWVRTAWEREGDKGRLFLLCRPKHAPAITPVLAVWIEVAAATILDLATNSHQRILFAVDELPSLPKLDYLISLAEQGRGFGACIVASVQSQAQLQQKYSRDGAVAFRSLFSTRVIFRAPDPDSAELASRLLGEEDVDVSRETEGHGKRGHSLSSDTRTRRLVTPTELLHLPNLSCYLSTGEYPIAAITLTPAHRPVLTPHFVPHNRGSWLQTPSTTPQAAPAAGPTRGPL